MEVLQIIPWLTIHVSAVMLTILIIIIADLHGLWWLLGKAEVLLRKRLEILHWLTCLGLVVTITTGYMMFSSYPEYLLNLPAFRLKMLFVLALIINAFLINKHMHLATQSRFSELTVSQKRAIVLSGFVSTGSWIGAYIAAHLLS